MENIDWEILRKIQQLDAASIKNLVKTEPKPSYRVTKSLLNLLHNICAKLVPVAETQYKFFEEHRSVVLDLLNKAVPLTKKHQLLLRNPALVLNITASCPSVDGS